MSLLQTMSLRHADLEPLASQSMVSSSTHRLRAPKAPPCALAIEAPTVQRQLFRSLCHRPDAPPPPPPPPL